MENIDAKLKLQNINKIQELESKYSKVYYIPGIAFLLGSVDLCCTYFTQQYMGSHIIENASDTMLA